MKPNLQCAACRRKIQSFLPELLDGDRAQADNDMRALAPDVTNLPYTEEYTSETENAAENQTDAESSAIISEETGTTTFPSPAANPLPR